MSEPRFFPGLDVLEPKLVLAQVKDHTSDQKLSRGNLVQSYTRTLSLFLVVAIAVVFCFLPVRNFSFINFDDNIYVTENPFVQEGLTTTGIQQAFRDTSTGHWHPLTWISHMLDCELFGLAPGAHHITNLILHALGSGLLLLLIYLASGNLARAALVAGIFGLHPMRIESVAWVSERKDVLSLFLGLGASCCYLLYCRKRNLLFYVLALASFAAGLLAKPTLVTLPLLLLLLDFWPLRRFSLSVIKEKIPFLLFSLLFSGIVIYAQWSGEGLRDLSEMSLSDRMAGAMLGYLAYFAKLFVPSGYGIFYPFATFAPGIGAGAFFGLVALSYWFLSQSKVKPYLVTGWIWFLLALLPVVGFVQVGGQLFADRWSYLAHIGLLISMVWYFADLLSSRSLALRYAVSGALLLICFIVTRKNLPNWKDSETLWQHTLQVSPHNFMAHTNLGSALDRAGKLEQAAFHYEEAVRLNPTYPEALNNLGILRARQARLPEAQDLLQKAVARRPNFIQARYNLGLVYSNSGNPALAAQQWCQVLNANPNYLAAKNSLDFLGATCR